MELEVESICPQYYNNLEETMIKQEKGFTLVELMITMVVFIFVMAAGSQIFSGLLTQFKQQSKITETNIEGVIGLEILRQDIEHAGYGLPFVIPDGLSYTEASDSKPAELPFALPYTPSLYNEATVIGTTNPPRGILSGDGAGWNGSDVLVIKAVNIARKPVTQKWTHLTVAGTKNWKDSSGNDIPSENFNPNDYIIALTTGHSDATMRSLLVSGTFFKQYSSVNDFAPPDTTEARYIYGINDAQPRMPFNRADYFIVTDKAVVPQRCARNLSTDTPLVGVLYKSLINHSDGALDANETLPLLDCVADMQVLYRIDSNADGTIDNTSDTTAALSDTNANLTIDAEEIRRQIKEVRVYLLAHEGQRDPNYRYPNETMIVGEFGLGRIFDLKAIIGDPDYQYYRWKLYTIVVNPIDLR
jgi:prepilin-type N-terminal cleavage/methylation domain-containing protein